MILIDLLIALVAPLLIPAINHVFSLGERPVSVVLGEDGMPDTVKRIPAFVIELPSAYVANAIWGLTYKNSVANEATIVWMVFYTFIGFGCLIYQVYSKVRPRDRYYPAHMKYAGFFLLILTIVRVFWN
jgi:hypothetical protein